MLKNSLLFFSLLFFVSCGSIANVDYSASEDGTLIGNGDKEDDRDLSDILDSLKDLEGNDYFEEDEFCKDDYEENVDHLVVELDVEGEDKDTYSVGVITLELDYKVLKNDLKRIYFDFDGDGDIDFTYVSEAGKKLNTKSKTYFEEGTYEPTIYVIDSEDYVYESSVKIVIK